MVAHRVKPDSAHRGRCRTWTVAALGRKRPITASVDKDPAQSLCNFWLRMGTEAFDRPGGSSELSVETERLNGRLGGFHPDVARHTERWMAVVRVIVRIIVGGHVANRHSQHRH